MKRMLVIVLIIAFALSGCSAPLTLKQNAKTNASLKKHVHSPFQYTRPLTLDDVQNALKAEGLQLNKTPDEKPDDYRIKNISPVIYEIKHNEIIFLIYIFPSIALRKDVCLQGEWSYMNDEQLPQKDSWVTKAYTAKNVLICNMFNSNLYQNNMLKNEKDFQALKRAVFSLNDGQKAVFTAKGKNWDARLDTQYYQHWYKDDEDTTHVDQRSDSQWTVKYLGSNPESVKDLRYEYTNQSHSGSGTGHLEKKGEDYYLVIGSSGDDGMINMEAERGLVIHWDGQKEALNLQRIHS